MSKHAPSVGFLNECFKCDFDKGDLHWKVRPLSHFISQKACNIWNGRYPGTEALSAIGDDGYMRGEVRLKTVKFALRKHRVIFALHHGYFPDEVDHNNGNITENWLDNLRAAERFENSRNVRSHRDRNPILPKWVCKVGLRFKAQVCTNGKQSKHLGYFDTPEQAYEVALAYARLHHKNFHRPD